MKGSYLEVTYRHGKPLAAYYYLPRSGSPRSYRSQELEPGLVVDFGRDGRALGIEIVEPASVTLAAMNRVLRRLRQPPIKAVDFSPLNAA